MIKWLEKKIDRIRASWAQIPNAPVISLLLVNFIPLFGVLFLRWSVFNILFLYWAENLVIGFYNVLRMIYWGMSDIGFMIAAVFTSFFFTFHYGAFCFGHGVFILALFGREGGGWAGTQTGTGAFGGFFDVVSPAIVVGILASMISHGMSFALNYIGRQEYKHLDLTQLMFAPYRRVMILHLVIIFGGGVTMAMGSPLGALVILVMLKTGMDMWGHLSERTRTMLKGEAVPVVSKLAEIYHHKGKFYNDKGW